MKQNPLYIVMRDMHNTNAENIKIKAHADLPHPSTRKKEVELSNNINIKYVEFKINVKKHIILM